MCCDDLRDTNPLLMLILTPLLYFDKPALLDGGLLLQYNSTQEIRTKPTRERKSDMDQPESHELKSAAEAYTLQLKLPVQQRHGVRLALSSKQALQALLDSDLDFHGESSAYASHNLHAFPAKFPPQLPRKFIEGLTDPGDVVLDPMVGSGTTIVEAFLTGRRGIGFDIDPLALRVCKAKITPLALADVLLSGQQVLERAGQNLQGNPMLLQEELKTRFGVQERRFLDYWFAPSTQLELWALLREIVRVPTLGVRAFLELSFSAIIITKSGGVSRARDLAHTRPHRVEEKAPRSALVEYRKRFTKNLQSLATLAGSTGSAEVYRGDSQALPLRDQCVDLIVTSPPYASNAIDYMRAHKFSLVWFGYPLDDLSHLRQEYIGHDAVSSFEAEVLPGVVAQIVSHLRRVDSKKAKVLERYYSEMARVLKEMCRVLKPGKVAIVVVGDSTMRGIDTRTEACLGEIGKLVGLDLVGIATRNLDRDKRMMPARQARFGRGSQIEERMHEEYVIGFLKPESQQEHLA